MLEQIGPILSNNCVINRQNPFWTAFRRDESSCRQMWHQQRRNFWNCKVGYCSSYVNSVIWCKVGYCSSYVNSEIFGRKCRLHSSTIFSFATVGAGSQNVPEMLHFSWLNSNFFLFLHLLKQWYLFTHGIVNAHPWLQMLLIPPFIINVATIKQWQHVTSHEPQL